MLPAELKKAREEKHLTLYDIAEATLVDIRFLRAIEEGNFSVLPQAYIRAFIKEYAAVVGLDPDDTIREYEKETADDAASEKHVQSPKHAQPLSGEPAAPRKNDKTSGTITTLVSQHAAKLAVIAFVTAIFVVTILNLTQNQDLREAPQESPFDRVVRENEERAGVSRTVVSPDSVGTPHNTAREDSLRLRGITSDSVWIEVAIDAQSPRQHLLRPHATVVWTAKDKFLLTIGNAGAIDFTLNQKHIGALGKAGIVVRNVEVSRQHLTGN